MSIQFHCAACRQPIEVDDEAANQAVTCPYCQKVVTAPAQSESSIGASSVQASALTGVPTVGAPNVAMTPRPTSTLADYTIPIPNFKGGPNKLAWASLIFVALGGLSFVIFTMMIARIIGPMSQPVDQAEITKRTAEVTRNDPGAARGLMFSVLGMCGFPLIAAGLAIGGLINGKLPRWPAVLTLGLLVIALLLFVISAIAYPGAMPGGGGGQ